jgi:hypothetical protein
VALPLPLPPLLLLLPPLLWPLPLMLLLVELPLTLLTAVPGPLPLPIPLPLSPPLPLPFPLPLPLPLRLFCICVPCAPWPTPAIPGIPGVGRLSAINSLPSLMTATVSPVLLAAVPGDLALARPGEIQPDPAPSGRPADQIDAGPGIPNVECLAPLARAGAMLRPLAAAVEANRDVDERAEDGVGNAAWAERIPAGTRAPEAPESLSGTGGERDLSRTKSTSFSSSFSFSSLSCWGYSRCSLWLWFWFWFALLGLMSPSRGLSSADPSTSTGRCCGIRYIIPLVSPLWMCVSTKLTDLPVLCSAGSSSGLGGDGGEIE